MAEEKIADQKTVQVDRHNGFVKPRMAAVSVNRPAGSRGFHRLHIAARTGGTGFRAAADNFTEIRPTFRVCRDFLEFLVKDGDADLRDCIKILQKRCKLFNIESGNHKREFSSN